MAPFRRCLLNEDRVVSSRFAGNAAGPIIATFILANSNLLSLYLALGAGLAAVAAGYHLGAKAQAKTR